MKERAKDFYLQRKGNCAQAVASAWSQFHGTGDEMLLSEFKPYSHGKAPGGLCGALYAACSIAGSEKRNAILEAFTEISKGNIRCSDIRSTRSLTCPECVAHAAELLSNVIEKKQTEE